MRGLAFIAVLLLSAVTFAADVETRMLTHFLPQDFLETAIRTEKWTEIPLDVKGGGRKDDVVRIWAGGSIDRGNTEQPGVNFIGPDGLKSGLFDSNLPRGALSANHDHLYALLFKTDSKEPAKCLPPGQPLEIKLTKNNEKLWIGFNDEKGRYLDNHLGKGRRHELDPLWVRIEVVRIVVE